MLLKKIDEVIQEKLASNDFSDGSDVLSMMHQMGEDDNLSIDEIKNVFIEILFAGHGTTSSAEAYLVYILVTHPEVRSKMKAEMMAHGLLRAKGADDKERPQLTLQQLNKLTYFNNVVKEVLRVSPPVGGGFRKALKTFEIGVSFTFPLNSHTLASYNTSIFHSLLMYNEWFYARIVILFATNSIPRSIEMVFPFS